ncbi:MAG TPA: methylated-DNA--[protein]-cysteine S-methyltransferase [Ktedonobacterales bacterium]
MTGDERAREAATVRATRMLLGDLRALSGARAARHIAELALFQVGLADHYAVTDTPLGCVYFAWSLEGLTLAMRAPDDETFERKARGTLGRAATPGEPPARLAHGVQAWVAGEHGDTLRFDLRQLTPFERDVLRKTREIPRGEVRPYGWIAREIGRPRAVRAVGTALAHNPIPIFIPCHRVVRTDGHIGAYSMGGREAKRVMLTAEGVDVTTLEALASSGVRYVGSESGRSYCYPTCRHAARIGTTHRVTFRDEAQAHAAGYRPCNVCRPPAARLAS